MESALPGSCRLHAQRSALDWHRGLGKRCLPPRPLLPLVI